jgi:hypothetical protein
MTRSPDVIQSRHGRQLPMRRPASRCGSRMKRFLIIPLIFVSVDTGFAFTANDGNKTISSDGSLSDTQAAVNYVAGKNADGWVLTVGAAGGSYTWNSVATVNVPHTFTIQGASSSNRTTINFGSGANLIINCAAGKPTTLKDFQFHNAPGLLTDGSVHIYGTGLCFRVTNCKWDNMNSWALFIGGINDTATGGPYGLVDHCQWEMPNFGNYMNVRDNGSISHRGWTRPMSWGTTDTVCVEDCTFTNTNGVNAITSIAEADAGARILVRHCQINNLAWSTHGRQSGAADSTLQLECLHNTFNYTVHTVQAPYAFWLRGGTAVINDNTISIAGGYLSAGFRFTEECAEPANWSSEHCSHLYTNPPDYPAFQQVGHGVVSGAQGLVPVYAWGNPDPGGIYYGLYEVQDTAFIHTNTEIIFSAKPGYTELVYPHPLRNGSGLSAPSNLRVISGL